MTDYRKIISSLSPSQREVFDRICEGRMPAASSRTINVLLRTSLVSAITQAPRPGLLPMIIGYNPEYNAKLAWQQLAREKLERELADRDHCAECGETMLYVQNRRICPNGHGRSVLDKRAPKKDKIRLEIIPADLRKARRLKNTSERVACDG